MIFVMMKAANIPTSAATDCASELKNQFQSMAALILVKIVASAELHQQLSALADVARRLAPLTS